MWLVLFVGARMNDSQVDLKKENPNGRSNSGSKVPKLDYTRLHQNQIYQCQCAQCRITVLTCHPLPSMAVVQIRPCRSLSIHIQNSTGQRGREQKGKTGDYRMAFCCFVFEEVIDKHQCQRFLW